jgi:cephalosporin hydroxylase
MKLENIIKKSLKEEPPANLSWVYQEFYSPYYNLMRLLAATIKDGTLVELGVHKGRGLASLAAGNPDNIIIGLDTVFDPDLHFVLDEFPDIEFLQRASLPATSDIFKDPHGGTYPIHLLHIDTEHSYAMAKAEFEAYKPYLVNGAYVLFDDLHAMDDDVLKYFNELPYYKIQDDRLHPICGYGVLVYEE